MATTIYGSADVAVALKVTRQAVSNYLYRHNDWPEPDFQTPDGRLFWRDLDGWRAWHALRVEELRKEYC